MYSILRTKKHKSIASVASRECHTYRRRPTPNADPAKLKKNRLLFGQENYADGLKDFLKNYQVENNIRKDAVLAIEYLLTASPEFFDSGSKVERDNRLKKWSESQIDFMKKMHGEENILCMYLHLDEKTPHIEVYVTPVDPKGKLNCKHFLGSPAKLTALQTSYATHNANFGLKRGQEGSRATHEEVKKFYTLIKGKAKITSADVKKAVKIDTPTISERINPTEFLEIQQQKIFARISKLFAGTIYENKLIAQAKKIMREWKRAEDSARKEKESLAAKMDDLHAKIAAQNKIIESVELLGVENSELQKELELAQHENKEMAKLMRQVSDINKNKAAKFD